MKPLVIGLFLVILAAIAGYFVFTSQKKSAGSDWKTYSNEKYDYSMGYPANWKMREFPDTKTGAAFQPGDKPVNYQYEYITIDAGSKPLNEVDMPFEEYVKIAATQEIQNYKSLASIKKITTDSGATGYVTTWMVAPMPLLGASDVEQQKDSESGPIAYFEIPGNKEMTIRVSLSPSGEKYRNIFDSMLQTVKVGR